MLSERDWNSSVDHDGYYGCTLRDKGFVPPSLATLDYARLTFVMRMGAKCADGKLEFDGSVVQNHVHTHFSKLDSGEPSCADTHAHARTHRVDMHMLIHTEAHAHARTNRVHMHVLMRTRRSTHFSRLGSGKHTHTHMLTRTHRVLTHMLIHADAHMRVHLYGFGFW